MTARKPILVKFPPELLERVEKARAGRDRMATILDLIERGLGGLDIAIPISAPAKPKTVKYGGVVAGGKTAALKAERAVSVASIDLSPPDRPAYGSRLKKR